MTIGALHCRSFDFATMPEHNPPPASETPPPSPETGAAAVPTDACESPPTEQPAAAAEPAQPVAQPQAPSASAPLADPSPAPAEVAPDDAAAAPLPAASAPPAAPAIADLSPAACAALLAERFPALFGAAHPLPIKLRIQADIQQRAPGLFNKKSLSIFLHRHTTATAYIKALAAAPHRFDLDGQPAGEIAPEHREAAAAELARRLAIVQARRAAEREALRQRQPPRGGAGAGPAGSAPTGAGPHPPNAEHAQPRPQRPGRPGRPDRRADTNRPAAAQRPPRHAANAAPDRPARTERMPRRDAGPPHGGGAWGSHAEPTALHEPAAHDEAALQPPMQPPTPEQAALNEARRARAALLRQYEGSTLTRANFCALKRMTETALEQQLEQARQERKLLPAPPHTAAEPVGRGGREARHAPALPRRAGRPPR